LPLHFITLNLFFLRGPTAAAWGGSLGLIGLFLTDWKVITGHIPYIKEKYEHVVPRLAYRISIILSNVFT